MAEPAYIPTNILLEVLKLQVEKYVGSRLDAVVFFRRDPTDALAARFNIDQPMDKGFCALRMQRFTPRGPLSNAGTPLNVQGALEAALVLPNGHADEYERQVQAMNELADVFRWELFHPTNINAVDSSLYEKIQKIEYVDDEDMNLDPSLLVTSIRYQIIPHRS